MAKLVGTSALPLNLPDIGKDAVSVRHMSYREEEALFRHPAPTPCLRDIYYPVEDRLDFGD